MCYVPGASGQGLVVFNNRVGNEIVAPVYNVEGSNPGLAKRGNSQVYNGAPLAGNGFTAQLFGGPTNTPVESLLALTPATTFRTDDGAGFVLPPSTAVAVPAVREGESARIQLRAWNNRGGAISNWVQVLADPTVARGDSLPIITPPLGSVFNPPPNLIGLESFNLALILRLSSPRRNANRQFQFHYENFTGIAYCIEASENLTHWTWLGNIPTGTGTFIDSAAANHPRRFYRALPCTGG